MALGGRNGLSQKATPLHPGISSPISLQYAQATLRLSLPSDHAMLAHCSGCGCRLDAQLAGPWVTSSTKQVTVAHLCCAPEGRSVSSMAVHRSPAPQASLCAGRQRSACLPSPWDRHLSLPEPCSMAECRSVFLLLCCLDLT